MTRVPRTSLFATACRLITVWRKTFEKRPGTTGTDTEKARAKGESAADLKTWSRPHVRGGGAVGALAGCLGAFMRGAGQPTAWPWTISGTSYESMTAVAGHTYGDTYIFKRKRMPTASHYIITTINGLFTSMPGPASIQGGAIFNTENIREIPFTSRYRTGVIEKTNIDRHKANGQTENREGNRVCGENVCVCGERECVGARKRMN